MNLQALDNALLRLAGARSGAVSRVTAVSRTDASRSVDPARVTDPRWLEIPRPDPAAIPLADIARFEALVHGAGGVVGAGDASGGGHPHPINAATDRDLAVTRFAEPEHIEGPLPPADRIVITLRHLRRVHGL